MKVKPLADRVLVERLSPETVSSGGIFLPTTAVGLSDKGKVICVGKGKVLDDGSVKKMEVKKGDLIMFTPNAGMPVKVDGKDYLVMSEMNIIAVIGK